MQMKYCAIIATQTVFIQRCHVVILREYIYYVIETTYSGVSRKPGIKKEGRDIPVYNH